MKRETYVVIGAGLLAAVLSNACPAGEQSPSNYEHLKELEYFIGEWDLKGSMRERPMEAQLKREWTLNRNFQAATATVNPQGQEFVIYRDIFGWNAATKSIKAWHFWATGQHTESVFSKTDNGWKHAITASGADGTKFESKGVFTIVDEDTYTYDSGGLRFTAKRKKK